MAYDNNYGYAQNGYTQYLDNSGKPLTGGSIETYIAGTTTPVLTFKDFNGGQNPHKITLDENGGATIILRQDTVYKFIIRDKNGDIFKTIDNIVTAGSTTVVEVDAKEVFFCRYNNTSYDDIREAYSAKKLIVMYKSQYNLYEYFLLDARDSHTFQFKKVEKDRITFFTIDDENGWSESYQNYEVDAQIPIASESVLGGIKVGRNLTIEPDGTLNAQTGGGGGSTYIAGDGIAITDSKISVNAGKGLGFDDDNKLEVKVGDGLDYDNDNKVITIDSDVSDVVATVNKLKEDLDQKITTTYPFAQITNQGDYAGFGVTNTSRMLGQLFAVPIASEIRKDETVLYVNALQNYSGDVSFGIFEYDFDGNDGSGSTYWIADTGKVTIQAGENRFPLLHVKNDIQELQSSKLYYAVIAIRGNAPSSGLYLASSPNYSTTYNANPKYTLLASNMDQYIDWNTGSLTGAWFQGYNEDNNIPRLFMMLRNGGEVAPPIPITEPFVDIGAFTLAHQYKISNQFSLTPTATGAVYRKVIPLKDVEITSFRYVDYRGSVGKETQHPVLLDDTYTPMKYISDGAWTLGDSDLTKIDGVHYVHEFTFSSPVQLTAGNTYWIMVGGNLGNMGDSWMITYSSPSVTNDLLLVADMHTVNSWIVTNGQGEYLGGAPGMYLELHDTDGNTYRI